MDKIFVVTSGCYSDYSIEKIFTTREAAEKYCASENAKKAWPSLDNEDEFGVSNWENECRVEEYPVDNVQFVLTEKPMKERYIYTRYQDKEYFTSYGTTYAKDSFVKVMKDTKECVQVAIVADYNTPTEKLKKIVYDEIARKKAAVNFLV